MKVVVACEFSGIVRDAFRDRGHWAVSVDLLPSERPMALGPTGGHWQGDALDVLRVLREEGTTVDLLVAFPPCTYLANSGARWLYGGQGSTRDPARWNAMADAADLFHRLLDADVPRIAVENPIMHGHARDLIERWMGGPVPRQTIQPWQFGHPETKATQLWLRNLPPLVPTSIVDGREARVHRASPSPDRWRERSRTLPGIAAAMADQWGALP